MKKSVFILSCILFTPLLANISPIAYADSGTQYQKREGYTKYEKLVLKNVSEFHKNFSSHEFFKNGDLVTDNIGYNSSGVQNHGREAFINDLIALAAPFPDAKITDLVTIVDGNIAAVRYVLTGTHQGDLETPDGVIPATGRKIKVDGIELFTFDEHGKVTDIVAVDNINQLLMQIQGK
ncbi:ester cyclase [Serratia marcescens]|nr:ester cyclase [Serratia marcescens]